MLAFDMNEISSKEFVFGKKTSSKIEKMKNLRTILGTIRMLLAMKPRQETMHYSLFHQLLLELISQE
ncbi:CLUMA_CG018204, isoform A [Clunio marinus]|uniref:CLUMA_CG018204, isoform A n=1 Tax=Clunio marinus TaxID=568069 RepID=A0A1J1J3T5_9DIPT|nr:CLUMA_CG018204, isoform A [Clunio marinus]